jgi:hypothetical protein
MSERNLKTVNLWILLLRALRCRTQSPQSINKATSLKETLRQRVLVTCIKMGAIYRHISHCALLDSIVLLLNTTTDKKSENAPHSQTVRISLTSAALTSLNTYYCLSYCVSLSVTELRGRILKSDTKSPYDTRQASIVWEYYVKQMPALTI